MDSGFYSAFSGFSSRLDALDLLANNIANVSTPGFKAQFAFYRSLPAWLQPSTTNPLNEVVNRFGLLSGSATNFTPSDIEMTGNPTDVALEGAGFFAVQAKNGVRYTRAGNFRLDAKRTLVTVLGDPVLGETGPIVIPAGQVAISADGTVSVDGGVVAKLKIVQFASHAGLKPEGNVYFTAEKGAVTQPVADPQLRQGALEASNSDPVRGAVELIDLQRTAQLMEKALSIFHNEFNKTAAEDLPRV